MSKHIFVTIVTASGIAANNRGENNGNITQLQKITVGDNSQFSTVSSESIRWAYRESFAKKYPFKVNRIFNDQTMLYEFKDEDVFNPELYIDDDVFGFMNAAKNKKNENVTKTRRGALEISRAISLDSFSGDVLFGSTSGEKNNKSIHNTEVHHTAYQYTLGITPNSLIKPERVNVVLEAITEIQHVGGNHSRFLFDFSPESIIIRITESASPLIINAFERGQKEPVGCPNLIRLVKAEDILPTELIVAGKIADSGDGIKLQQLGVTVLPGIKKAVAKAQEGLGDLH
jgi:CRISPR-associated protein Cst2